MPSRLEVLPNTQRPWYHKGLPFKCTECGKCCTGSPGYVWVGEEDITRMADFLKMDLLTFHNTYLRYVLNRWSLREDAKTFDCVFLKDKKCSIYTARPKQCRTFPWWVQNLASEEAWKETAERCEGIQPSAPIVPAETIDDILRS